MAVSRRARSRRAALEAARRQVSGRWRAGGGGGDRVLVILALSAALIGVGFVLGRWSAGGFGTRATVETAPGAAVADASDAATSGADAATPRSGADGATSHGASEASLESVAHAGVPIDAALGVAAADLVDQPAAPAPTEFPVAAANAGPVAIVIDDLGRSLEVIDELRAYGVPLTYAILPYETKTAAVAARLSELGEEVLCHLPMEPQSGDPGPGALTEAMTMDELRDATRKALEAVPGAVGVNNHMGSALSADREAMTTVVNVVRRRQLFFLDSRTSAASVGYAVARELGIPAAERKVFLDPDRNPDAIRHEVRRLLALANKGEPAIAIGHPYPETLAVLEELIPKAKENGFRFVRVSDVLVTH